MSQTTEWIKKQIKRLEGEQQNTHAHINEYQERIFAWEKEIDDWQKEIEVYRSELKKLE